MFYAFVHLLANIVFRLLFRLEARGTDRVPREGPFILASNHLSNLDPFLLGAATRRRLAYFAKVELFENRVGGYLLRKLNAFPVRRGQMDRSALQGCLDRLGEGMGVVFFPEGTRRMPGQPPGEPKPGLGMIAVRSGVPIVPVRIMGSDGVLPPGKAVPRPRKVVVLFGEPASPLSLAGEAGAAQGKRKVYLRLAQRVLQRIYDLR